MSENTEGPDLHCRIGCENTPRLPCPECGACFACASDDCGACVVRLDFLNLEVGRQPLWGTDFLALLEAAREA